MIVIGLIALFILVLMYGYSTAVSLVTFFRAISGDDDNATWIAGMDFHSQSVARCTCNHHRRVAQEG